MATGKTTRTRDDGGSHRDSKGTTFDGRRHGDDSAVVSDEDDCSESSSPRSSLGSADGGVDDGDGESSAGTAMEDGHPTAGVALVSFSFAILAFLFSVAISFLAGGFARYLYLGRPHGGVVNVQQGEDTCAADRGDDAIPPEESVAVDDDAESETSSPPWQHVTMTLDDLDGRFDSLERVEGIMTDGLDEWVDHLLSYHCHTDGGDIVDGSDQHHCVGLLDGGGFVAASSVPGGERVAGQKRTVHLFYSGGSRPIGNGAPLALFDFVASVERLIIGGDAMERVDVGVGGLFTQWGHRSRVRHFDLGDFNNFSVDPFGNDLGLKHLSRSIIGARHVASTRSAFQRIDVVDFLDPTTVSVGGHLRSLDKESSESYEVTHPELYRPNRIVFLDGVEQSTSTGEEAYHEALVHPGLFAHPNPRRAAIIGGGEGATLREILKHDTIDHVKMIEIYEIMVHESRRYLPEWSSCADVVGSADNCFDDPRADTAYEDAMAWFVDRFITAEEQQRIDALWEGEGDDDDKYSDKSDLVGSVEPFDFIVMDALDPEQNVDFAEVLYTDEAFLQSLYNGLSDDGVLALQLSYSPWPSDPPEDFIGMLRESVKTRLQQLGFQRMYEYEESHCNFEEPWVFLIACKSADSCHRNMIQANPALRDVSLHRRMRRTKSGRPILRHVDGPTLTFYEVPPRYHEDAFCKTSGAPADCVVGRGYDPERAGQYYSAENGGLEYVVASSAEDDDVGVGGLLAKVDIPKGSYVDSGDPIFLGHGIRTETMKNFTDFGVRLEEAMKNFSGFFNTGVVSAVATTSTAKGNVGDLATYMLLEGGCSPLTPEGQCHAPRNLVMDRHAALYGTGMMLALRNISAGEKIVLG